MQFKVLLDRDIIYFERNGISIPRNGVRFFCFSQAALALIGAQTSDTNPTSRFRSPVPVPFLRFKSHLTRTEREGKNAQTQTQ